MRGTRRVVDPGRERSAGFRTRINVSTAARCVSPVRVPFSLSGELSSAAPKRTTALRRAVSGDSFLLVLPFFFELRGSGRLFGDRVGRNDKDKDGREENRRTREWPSRITRITAVGNEICNQCHFGTSVDRG